MNYKMMGRFVSQVVFIEALFLIPAMIISLGYGEMPAVSAFAITFGIMLALAGLLYLLCRKAGRLFGAREGFVCVSLGWIVMSLLGALPFVLSGDYPNYIDALFEIVSGFTTTGSSVHPNVAGLYRGILYWRSFSNWIGGMGVLVFLLAILPGSQGGGFTMHLLRAESPGPDVGKLVPKMRQTAVILYVIYVGLTIVDFILLLFGDMHWLHALCSAFSTAGTGGFGVFNDSFASASPYIQNVTTVFMFLFGINFSCFYLILLGRLRSVFKDEELRLYIGLALCSIIVLVLTIRPLYGTLEEAIRHATFQVGSLMSSTGFASADFDAWPSLAKGILLLLMAIGACAGSTGGGLKCIRLLLLFKILRRNIRQTLNPQKVLVVRNNDKTVDEKVLSNVNAYFAAYVIIFVICMLVLSLDTYPTEAGFSAVETNFSVAISAVNNMGPGFGAAGPTLTFAEFSPLTKIVLSVTMLAGRLEFFPILVLFSKSTWKKR